MRPAIVIANSPACQTGQLRDRLRGPWRQGLRGVMVLLSLRGLAPAEIAALLECHLGRPRLSPRTLYRRVRLVAVWRRPKLFACGDPAHDQAVAAIIVLPRPFTGPAAGRRRAVDQPWLSPGYEQNFWNAA